MKHFYILSFLPLVVLFFQSCNGQSHDFKYQGDYPTWEYLNLYNAAEIGDITSVDTTMVRYRNRIYVTIDSQFQILLNNHKVDSQGFINNFENIYTNPEQLSHLPEAPSKAVIFLALNYFPKGQNPAVAFKDKKLDELDIYHMMEKVIGKLRNDYISNHPNENAEETYPMNIALYASFMEDINEGIAVKLPPYSEEAPQNIKVRRRNVFRVVVNAQNQLFVRGEPMEVKDLKESAKKFINNRGKDPNLSESPKRAIISLQNDRETEYEVYLKVYNELKAAYNELWDELALEKFGQKYKDLSRDKQKEITAEIPLVISEAEPTFGE